MPQKAGGVPVNQSVQGVDRMSRVDTTCAPPHQPCQHGLCSLGPTTLASALAWTLPELLNSTEDKVGPGARG